MAEVLLIMILMVEIAQTAIKYINWKNREKCEVENSDKVVREQCDINEYIKKMSIDKWEIEGAQPLDKCRVALIFKRKKRR